MRSRATLLRTINNDSKINEKKRALYSKNNEYINTCLRNVLNRNFNDLCQSAIDNNFNQETLIKSCKKLLDKLTELDFGSAYIKKEITRDSTGELNQGSFNAYLSLRIPGVDELMLENIVNKESDYEIDQVKNIFIDDLKNIKDIINQYGNENKNMMVAEFNEDMAEVINNIYQDKKTSKRNDLVDGYGPYVNRAVNRLKDKEDIYYEELGVDLYLFKLSFFNNYRKGNSSLKVKIDEAEQAMKNMQIKK